MTVRAAFTAPLCALALATLAAPCAHAITGPWPDRPIRIVVPPNAGGAAETVARTVAREMQKSFGQPVIVESRAWGTGAPADGYTLLLATSASLATLDAAAFAPISTIGSVPYAIFVNPKVPVRSAQELASYAGANKLAYGTVNAGEHLAASQFAKANGIEMTRVTYTASPVGDLAAGKIQVYIAPIGQALAESKKGRVRLLATLTAERTPFTPSVPSLGEEALPVPSANASHQMLLAPAKTPPDIVARLAREVQAAIGNRAVREELHKSFLLPRASSPGELAKLVAEEQKLVRP